MDDMEQYGTLTSYTTGQSIRPASWGEWARSVESGPTGAYWDPSHGDVFVAGGPAVSSQVMGSGECNRPGCHWTVPGRTHLH